MRSRDATALEGAMTITRIIANRPLLGAVASIAYITGWLSLRCEMPSSFGWIGVPSGKNRETWRLEVRRAENAFTFSTGSSEAGADVAGALLRWDPLAGLVCRCQLPGVGHQLKSPSFPADVPQGTRTQGTGATYPANSRELGRMPPLTAGG